MKRSNASTGRDPGALNGALAIAHKEMLHMRRNPILLRMHVAYWAIYFVMFGFIDVNVRHIPTVIVDQDATVESRALVQRLVATSSFEVAFERPSPEDARRLIEAGRAGAAVVIPAGYARERKSGGTAHVLALVDGSDQATTDQASSSLDGVVQQLNLDALNASAGPSSALVRPRSVMLFNPQGKESNFLLPAALAYMMVGFMILPLESLASERDNGNFERLLMTPINYTSVMLGKLVPHLTFGAVNGLIYLAIIHWGFGVPLRGDLIVLAAAVTLFTATMVTLGLLLAATAPSPAAAGVFRTLFFSLTMLASGLIFPLSTLPAWLRPISYLVPATHMVRIMRAACLRGAGFAELIPNFAYLFLAPLLFLLIARKKFAATIIQ